MKKLGIIISFLISSFVYCQTQPEAFLSRIPSLPDNACSMTKAQKQAYEDNLAKIHDELDKEIERREKTVDENYAGSEEQIKQNTANQYGLSASDMEKLEKDEMTEEEKQAMINKMMQKKNNLSMDEVKKLNNTSEEGQKAWAEAYSTEKMANVQADSESAKKEQNTNKRRYDLAKEQSLILQKMRAAGDKYIKQMNELNKLDTAATKELNKKRKPLMDQFEKDNKNESVIEAVRKVEKEYCNKLTPEYYNIINNRLTTLKTMMPDYNRLDEVSNELNQITLGTKKKLSSPGLTGLKEIEDYISLLGSAFKYAHYTFPDDYIIFIGGD